MRRFSTVRTVAKVELTIGSSPTCQPIRRDRLGESCPPRHRNERGFGGTRQDGSEGIGPADSIRSGPWAQSGSGVDARRAELSNVDNTHMASGRGRLLGLPV